MSENHIRKLSTCQSINTESNFPIIRGQGSNSAKSPSELLTRTSSFPQFSEINAKINSFHGNWSFPFETTGNCWESQA
jgi:hypothetical protein